MITRLGAASDVSWYSNDPSDGGSCYPIISSAAEQQQTVKQSNGINPFLSENDVIKRLGRIIRFASCCLTPLPPRNKGVYYHYYHLVTYWSLLVCLKQNYTKTRILHSDFSLGFVKSVWLSPFLNLFTLRLGWQDNLVEIGSIIYFIELEMEIGKIYVDFPSGILAILSTRSTFVFSYLTFYELYKL